MAKGKTKEPEAEVDELEELSEDEAEDKPSKNGKSDEVTFGVVDLAKLIKKVTGKEYTPRDLRTLIRKMARDGSKRVDREIVAGNKARYDWTGPKDPEVIAIVKAVKGGELEEGRKAALAKLKQDKANKKAAEGGKKGDKKGKKGKAAKVEAETEVDDAEDFSDLED